MTFMLLKGLFRLFLAGLPSRAVFFGPWATRGDKSMRAGWRFWKVAAPRVCLHGVEKALGKALASQNGHIDEDARRNMLMWAWMVGSQKHVQAITCFEVSPSPLGTSLGKVASSSM